MTYILSIDVSQFSKDLCGDGICQGYETFKSCSLDCPSGLKDGYCDKISDNICDPDCKMLEDPDCTPEAIKAQKAEARIETAEKALSYWPYYLIAAAIILLIMILKKLKREQKEEY